MLKQIQTLFLGLFFVTPSAYAIVGGVSLDEALPPYLSNADRQGIFSHTVGLVNLTKAGEHAICTGVLIDENVVLTAAHCAKASAENLKVVFSEVTFAVFDRVGVKKIVVHPKYIKFDLPYKDEANYDVALLLLEKPAPSFYKPIKILNQFTSVHDRFWAYVAGYGQTSLDSMAGTLRFARTTISDYKNQSQYSYLVGDEQKKEGVCRGDSGGPVLIKVQGEFRLLALTSGQLMIPDNCRGVPYFNSLSFYKKWVDENLKYLKTLLLEDG